MPDRLGDIDHRLGPTDLIWFVISMGVFITVWTSSAALAQDVEKGPGTVLVATVGGIALLLFGWWERVSARARADEAQERVTRAERQLSAHATGEAPLRVEEKDLWTAELQEARDDLYQARQDTRWAAWTMVVGGGFASYAALVGFWHILFAARRPAA